MRSLMLHELRRSKQLPEIDFEFAEYIIAKEGEVPLLGHLYLASFCLSHFANQQHSMLPLDRLRGCWLSEMLQCELEQDLEFSFPADLDWLKSFPNTVGAPGDVKPLIYDHGALYLHKYYMAEQCIVDTIKRSSPIALEKQSLSKKINQLFEDNKAGQTDWQKVAAFMALRSSFCVISGGPGTGKTTTVGKILMLLLEQDPSLKIHLVAPTGKAADRLGESIQKVKLVLQQQISTEMLAAIPDHASTIHRYLGYNGLSRNFKYRETNQTDSDLLIVDESSMVSLPLFRHLLLSLKRHCRVILLGDKDQLTAVETGNVLGELTHTKKINTFSKQFCQEYQTVTGDTFEYIENTGSFLQDRVLKLEHSYRFRDDQGVGKLAALINHCTEETQTSDFDEVFVRFEDISFHRLTQNFSVLRDLAPQFFESYKKRLSEMQTITQPEESLQILECLSEFRALCASRVGPFGVENLNQMISQKVFEKEDRSLYHGRCIMVLQNNRHLQIYNGDVGVVLHKAGLPHVYFHGEDGKAREFNPTILPRFETAFAMTVHKSQGSEYDQVCLVLPEEGQQHVRKELIYTGVTRARSRVKIFSQMEGFLEMCQKRTERYSGIAQKLQ